MKKIIDESNARSAHDEVQALLRKHDKMRIKYLEEIINILTTGIDSGNLSAEAINEAREIIQGKQ